MKHVYKSIAPPHLWQLMPKPPAKWGDDSLILLVGIMRAELVRMELVMRVSGIEFEYGTVQNEPDKFLADLREGLALVLFKMLIDDLNDVEKASKDLDPTADSMKAEALLKELLNKIKRPT